MLKTTAPGDISSFLDRDPEPLSSSAHAQPHRASESRRAGGAHRHERGVRFARESREPHRDRARDGWRGVEHDQRERGASQQHVRAPRGASGLRWPQHPEPRDVSQMCPIARRERARRVDVRDPFAALHRRLYYLPEERQLSGRSHHFREPPARQPARRERAIECLHARRHPRRQRKRRGKQSAKRLDTKRGRNDCGDSGTHVKSSGAGFRSCPKKHRKHATGKENRQRLSADGLSTACPHTTTSEFERQLRHEHRSLALRFVVIGIATE